MTSSAETLRVRILYFARLQEISGRAEETRTLPHPATAGSLYALLQKEYGFDFTPARLRAAVNHDFCAWDTPLHNGDTVAFIPPVAGG